MALSGSFTGTTANQYITPKIIWNATQSVSGNYSTVTATLTYSRNNTGYASEGDWSGSLTINGNTTTATKHLVITYNSNTIAVTHTVQVAHDADGTKSITISADGSMPPSTLTSTSISATVTLSTIPRATTPTLSAFSVYMGDNVTISLPRASSHFTHDLAYSFAGGSYISIKSGVDASYNWIVPDMADSIPNAISCTVTIRCITRDGSASIGTKYVTMSAVVPDSVVPTISAVNLSEATSGLAAQFGTYVKGKSKVKATITAAGAKGSTINSYNTSFQGATYVGASWTSGLLNSSGSLSMTTTVTDSRGRTAQKTTTITGILDYTTPAITALQVYRANVTGELDQDGTDILVQIQGSVAPVGNKNTASLVLEYKQSTGAEWKELDTSEAISYDTSAHYPGPFSTDYQYDVRATLTDWFGAKTTYTTVLPSGAVILDISADGKGIAFGTTSDREGVLFGWHVKGRVFGLGEATAFLPEGADLNDYYAPGIYSTGGNANTKTLLNRPCDYAGTIRVYNAIGEAKTQDAWTYMLQEYRSYVPEIPTYLRLLQTSEDGSWSASAWYEH